MMDLGVFLEANSWLGLTWGPDTFTSLNVTQKGEGLLNLETSISGPKAQGAVGSFLPKTLLRL